MIRILCHCQEFDQAVMTVTEDFADDAYQEAPTKIEPKPARYVYMRCPVCDNTIEVQIDEDLEFKQEINP